MQVTTEAASPGDVEKNGRGRPAVHRPIIDSGEKDHGAGGIHESVKERRMAMAPRGPSPGGRR